MARETPPPGAPLSPGLRLDRYELLCPIADGGTASVWLARLSGKHGFEKLVVVKAVRRELAEDERFRATFLEEARAASNVRHPNVAQILDLGEEQGVLYVVTEWVDGDSLLALKTTLQEKQVRFPLGVALRVLADACGGLHAAHELSGADGVLRPVLHRDLSPQNLLVNTQGVAKVIDFGAGKAKSRAREAAAPARGGPRAHRVFSAPEQARAGIVDPRADVWAVAATLYFLVTGSAPYEAANEAAALARLLSGEPPAPLPAGTPDAVVAIVERGLARPIDRRVESAAELQRMLVEALAEQGATSTSDVARFVDEHLGERARQRRALVQEALDAAHDRERRAAVSASGQTSEQEGRRTSEVSGWGAVAATRAPPRPRLGTALRVTGTAVIVAGSLAGVAALGFTLASRGPAATGPSAPAPTTSSSPAASVSGAPSSSTSPAPEASTAPTVAAGPSAVPPPVVHTRPAPRPAPRPAGTPARSRDYGF